jgi:hypothetical protein
MKYAILAAAFAVTVSFGLSAHAAPISSSALKFEASRSDAVQQVGWDSRHRWHGRRDRHDHR